MSEVDEEEERAHLVSMCAFQFHEARVVSCGRSRRGGAEKFVPTSEESSMVPM